MSTNTDFWSGVPARALIPNNLGVLADAAGSIAGWVQKPADLKLIKDYLKNKALSFVPGVGAYRIARRRRAASKGDFTPIAHEIAGSVLTSIALIAAGTFAGLRLGASSRLAAGRPAMFDALIGAGAGAGVSALAHLAGNITAQTKKRRTKLLQLKADKSGLATALKYLMPGYAAYSYHAGARSADAV